MGLPALRGTPNSSPQVGDGVIRGYLVSAEGGSTIKRLVIGFGAGSSEMDTVVEGYAVTPQGWRKLGSGTLSSSGNMTPGLIVPAAVVIATGNPIGLIVVGGRRFWARRAAATGSREERKPRPVRSRSSSNQVSGPGLDKLSITAAPWASNSDLRLYPRERIAAPGEYPLAPVVQPSRCAESPAPMLRSHEACP